MVGLSRRAHGEGTVYREGDRWVARIDLPSGPDGKRRQAKRRARTKTEAHRVLRTLQSESTTLANLVGTKRTVGDAVDAYLSVQPSDRAPKTIVMENWRAEIIRQGLGRRRLEKLTVVECDAFLTAAAAGKYGRKPLGRDATRRVRSLLVNVFRNEQRTGNVSQNIPELSVMPNASAASRVDDHQDGDSSNSVRRALTHAEYQELWRIARHPLLVLIDLCGRNGLRPSEARALRWDRVDLDNLTLAVRRQMSTENQPTKAKTKRSVRMIGIDSTTADVLSDWRRVQLNHRDHFGSRWREHNLVVSTRYGTGIDAANFRRLLTAASTRAGIGRVVPYELRHTAITHQIEAGHDTWHVADWAGTSERMIEEIYRHRLNRVSKLGPVVFDRGSVGGT